MIVSLASEIRMKLSVPALVVACTVAFGAPGALAIDFPTLKPGMWESQLTRNGAGQKSPTMKMCMDASLQKEMMESGMGTMKELCTKNDIRREGNKVFSNAECKFGDSTMKSTSVTTFTADTAYHTEVKATYVPPMAGKGSDSTVIDAKWTGPCPAGMQPGDVILPDGRKINMRTMAPPK
jgi:hypothetical protein